MKKSKVLLIMLIFCIILSSFALADPEDSGTPTSTPQPRWQTGPQGGAIEIANPSQELLMHTVENDEGDVIDRYIDRGTQDDGTERNRNTFVVTGDGYGDNVSFYVRKNDMYDRSGAYVVSVQNVNGNPVNFVIQRKGTDGDDNWYNLRMLAYDNPDGTLELYSPTSNYGGNDVVVWMQQGYEYRIMPIGTTSSSPYTINFYRNPAINDNVTCYQTNKSASRRTCGSESDTNLEPLIDAPGLYDATGRELITTDGRPEVIDFEGIRASTNPFEKAFNDLLLLIGDGIKHLLDAVFGEAVTVSKLIYNKIAMVNPNFFDAASTNSLVDNKIREAVNKWFMFFRGMAIVFYLVAFLTIALHVLFSSTGEGIQKAKNMMMDWLKGIAILFFIPIVMKYTMAFNDALIRLLVQRNTDYLSHGKSFSDGMSWSAFEINFRSPKYVSKKTGYVQYSSEEVNMSYVDRLTEYETNFDLLNIMRAFAGATGQIGYSFLWYVCLGQLITFMFIYVKRFFTIVFLIAIFPITSMFNAISILRGQKGMQMNTWMKEFISNVFVQFIHAVVYSLITGACVQLLFSTVKDGQAVTKINWLVMLIAINFVPEGEKILKKVLSSLSSGNTTSGLSDGSGKIKNAVKNGFNHMKGLAGR